ncbi:MAG: DUF1592 domain-containing protein [Bryobacterales bacterium]|nr:DUF1592 domain-containing protein [Bryobacterales bacterium]
MSLLPLEAICAQPLPAQTKPAAPASAFDQTVKPMLNRRCFGCHNDRTAAGGLNIAPFTHPSSINEYREAWDKIVSKVRSGEMPPKEAPKPTPEQIATFTAFMEAEFEKADRKVQPDPGRVTARRLNRNEYSNTIRDLLAVDFRAEKDFPTDDSGYGFDNIGDVLTISPMLMDKYVRAAERISARAIGADPLPKKPLEFEFSGKGLPLRRVDRSTVELTHQVDWDAEYNIIVQLPGERAADAKPVEMAFWMDGKLIHKMWVETKPSKLVYFNPMSVEEFKVTLPEGDHVFRMAFLNDEFVKTLSDKEARDQKKNKYIGAVTFQGPFALPGERASRKKILICDPKTGKACVDKILSTLARRAYRRPVTRLEVAQLAKFVDFAKADGQTVEQGIQLAIQAMLVSPKFLFRMERDPNPLDAGKVHPISDLELASRLSYFLWSSMPDDDLLALAEKNQLREPGVLDAQVKRMLADARSAAFADNFAGQWLETRNLDSVKPDPVKFADWGPDLREAMKMETRLFFENILRNNRPMSEFLSADYTYLNDRLARHYGIAGVDGPEFRRVQLATDQRGGITSHASVLTVSSYPTRTSPVIRGKYVLSNILGSPAPEPPPDVPALDEAAVGNKGSLRQQLEQHRTNPVCASCHSRMDVLGFGLENYDAIGRWRTMDGKFPIDVSGTLPNGKSFTTPAEMRKLLIDNLPDFTRCITEKMLTYALGRGLERYDRRTVTGIVKAVANDDYKFQTLISEVVRSLPFQNRRGEVSRKQEGVAKGKEIAAR